jgi:CubicO group peptidase (beta-lactamase class C family)
LCSAVFISGLDFDFAAETIGYFSSPYDQRAHVSKREVDWENKAVHVTLPNGIVRTAKYFGDQGCICLPEGEEKPYFEPSKIISTLPDAASTPWPMGDRIDNTEDLANSDKINEALDLAFADPEALTAAVVITHKGQLIGERYRDGITMHTPLESWSMGKSLTGTLMGILINQGVYELYQPAPIPEWQKEGDKRTEIRIADIMRMSSGIRFRAPQDPDFDPTLGYPDHLYVYTGSINSFEYAAKLPQQWPPNTIGRYRNCDPVLTNYLIRLGVEGKGEDYHSFPTKTLFDKLGMRNMVLETDPYGNFLLQGYEFGTARDWARLGNLYLQDGIWNGERLLPEGYVEYASTIAPAWQEDGRPIYGGAFFWINGDETWPVPKEAYFMAGAGGQFTIIIPSHDLVVVRLGHYKGGGPGADALRSALKVLMEAVATNSK